MGKGLDQPYPCLDTNPAHYSGLPYNEGSCVVYAGNRAVKVLGSGPLTTGMHDASNYNAGANDSLTYGGNRFSAGSTSPHAGDFAVNCTHGAGHAYFFESQSIITHSNYRNPGNGGADYINGKHNMGSCVPYGNISGSYSGDFIFRGDGSGGGGGGGGVPPEPPPSANWDGRDTTGPVQQTMLVMETVTYSDMYECGVGATFGAQSGTQDAPQAPYSISGSTNRYDQRGEPFNMYTDERVLTYTADGQPIGSNGETKYTGQATVPLGSQPDYGNGGEMEGQGDDD